MRKERRNLLLAALAVVAVAGGSGGFGIIFRLVIEPPTVLLQSPEASGGGFSFNFQSAAGQSYTIQQNASPVLDGWADVTNLIGDGSSVLFSIPIGSNSARFFRVREH